jgi:pyruvate/2-oxoglutarate/acetoin dehydrogenase E1 component
MSRQNTVLQTLNTALHQAMAQDERVVLIGEDLLDPYGGAFKVTQGLSSAFPRRVLSSPISEAGIVGLGAGMAMRGLRPVVELMFGDFITLAADQIINHIAKFAWMYNGNKTIDAQVRVPLVIRTPMGGRRGYGPTHSQTLEKIFLGIPGLRILTPCSLVPREGLGPGDLLSKAILVDDNPVIFIENKLLYLATLQDTQTLDDWVIHVDQLEDHAQAFFTPGQAVYPTFTLSLRGAPAPTISIATYGYMADLALHAAHHLAYHHEVFTEVIIYTQLAPFDIRPVLVSLRRTSRLLTVEEGSLSLGWGAEILARVVETPDNGLHTAARLAANELPIPASGFLESIVLPDEKRIVETCLNIV